MAKAPTLYTISQLLLHMCDAWVVLSDLYFWYKKIVIQCVQLKAANGRFHKRIRQKDITQKSMTARVLKSHQD